MLNRIRRLTEDGIGEMRDFLASFDAGTPWPFADAQRLLADSDKSEAMPNPVDVDGDKAFARRYDLAEYLSERIPRLGLPDPTRDAGLWAWLALLWFEQLRSSGQKPGKPYRYIPELDNFQRYYRHLVLGPYLTYRAHKDNPARALCMLCQRPAIHPDTAESLASRYDLIQSHAVIGAATKLYYDSQKGAVRRGSTSREGKVPKAGTVRRLVDVCWQLDRTYDHLACSTGAFMRLLPTEFRRFMTEAC